MTAHAVPRPATFTDDEFERLIGKGAFDDLGRVELREGVLIRMNAQYAPHGRAKSLLFRRLADSVDAAGLALEASVEISVRFGGGFMPLPDIFLWAARDVQGPVPGDAVRLVIEVADSTLQDDLGPKRESYAKAGAPEYWVVDLNARVIHQFAAPKDGAFTRAALVAFGEAATCLTLAGVRVETTGLA